MKHKYPLKTRAFAMELLHKSNTIVEVSHKIGCGIRTVSRWYMDYLGYRGKEGIIEVKQSKLNSPRPVNINKSDSQARIEWAIRTEAKMKF